MPQKRTSFYPLIALGIFISTILVWRYQSQESPPKINEQELKHFLEKGHVRDVVLIRNKLYVKVFIHKKYLLRSIHEKLFVQNQKLYRKGDAYYIMKIASVDIFDKHYQSIQRQLPSHRRLLYSQEDEHDFSRGLMGWKNLLILLMLLLLLLLFLGKDFIDSSERGGIFGIGKSQAVLWGKERKINITLADVAGMEEEKEEIQEVIEALKNPEKIKKLGGKIPKGILLIGEPGTGKTLLAKAVAGEAGVPFFSVSGSDFIEIFVGVGPSRVRNLFEEARKNAPCVIFIDEIDSIGRSRSTHKVSSGGSEEREGTLNKLLTEMDGFGSDNSIVVLGATNRADILDPALRRAGRFDTQIVIGYPTIKERKEIFDYHIKKTALKVMKRLSLEQLATQTAGFTGADIANTCNQAALVAAREGKNQINMKHFQESIDRVTIGLEKKSKVISPQEKLIVAWHESGHAVAAWFLEHAAPLIKVSMIPRGPAALGYAQYLPKEQAIYQLPQLEDSICVLLAARAAEEITFGKISTGASDDLKRSTAMAYNIVRKFGMDEKIGHLSFDNIEDGSFREPYSNATGEQIDTAVQKIIKAQYQRAKSLLKKHQDELKAVAEALLTKEVLFTKDVEKLIGKQKTGKKA